LDRREADVRHRVVVFLVLLALAVLPGCSLVETAEPLAPDATSTDTTEPLGRVLASVVEVRTSERGFGVIRQGIGTGVVYDVDGTIVTNDHVLRIGETELADTVTVILPDGTEVSAEVVKSLPDRDLAFLDIDVDGLVAAEFVADIDDIEEGQEVFAVGAPRRFQDAVVDGTITLVRAPVRVEDLPGLTAIILTDARIRRGFSGGPLADAASGRIVGLNAGITMRMEGEPLEAITIPAPLVVQAADGL